MTRISFYILIVEPRPYAEFPHWAPYHATALLFPPNYGGGADGIPAPDRDPIHPLEQAEEREYGRLDATMKVYLMTFYSQGTV
jgi:hypothetical protein